MINEYDQRQLSLMAQKILEFKKKRIYLGQLINDLDALLSVLKKVDISWKEKFHEEWWSLEQIYAFALDEDNYEEVVEDNKELLNSSIDEMKRLINVVTGDGGSILSSRKRKPR